MRANQAEVTIDGKVRFSSDTVSGCTIERMYDGLGQVTTVTIYHDAEHQ